MIWEKQKEESNKNYYFFNLYLKSNYRNITEFTNHIYENCAKTVQKYTPPKSKRTFQNIAYKNNWIKRAKAHDEYEYLITHMEILKIDTSSTREEYTDLIEISKKLLTKIKEFINNLKTNKMTSKDAFILSQLVSSLKTVIELRRLISEQSTENIHTHNEHVLQDSSVNSFEDLSIYQKDHDSLFE